MTQQQTRSLTPNAPLYAVHTHAHTDTVPRAGDGQISFEELSAFLFEDDVGDAEPDRNYQLAMSAIRKEVEKYTRGSALLRGKAFRSPLYKQNGLTVDELAAKIRGYFKIPLEGADLAAVFKKHDAGTGLFDFEQLCRQRAGGAVREKAQAQIEKELFVTGLDRNWAQLTTEEREHRKQIRRTFGRTQLAGAREGASLRCTAGAACRRRRWTWPKRSTSTATAPTCSAAV